MSQCTVMVVAGGGSTVAILIPSRGRKSPQAFFFFCISFFSLSLSFSFTETVVIYDQPRDVCFVCSRVPVKYFTARNEHILRNRSSSTNRRIRRAMTLPVSFLRNLLRASWVFNVTKIVKIMFCRLFVTSGKVYTTFLKENKFYAPVVEMLLLLKLILIFIKIMISYFFYSLLLYIFILLYYYLYI